ncbi:ImmA/IrrE family metallo-endopeptidase [soil metagenome]
MNDPVVAGSRVAALRMFLGLTQTDLARIVGKSQGTVAKYEATARNTVHSLSGSHTLTSLTGALGCGPDYLIGEEIAVPDKAQVSFRKRRSATKGETDRARAALALSAGLVLPAIQRTLRLPPPDVPDLSDETPEDAAALLRAQWNLGIGPIGHLIRLLEAKGVRVSFLEGRTKSLDALCLWQEGVPHIALSTTKQDGARARFDAAHELGHLVLHQGFDFGDEDNAPLEAEADRFAAAFLVPAEAFVHESPIYFSVDAFANLRSRWGMSMQALVRRSRDVGRINQTQYITAYKRMSALGWRSGPEPGAPQRENSYIHDKFFEVIMDRQKPTDLLITRTSLPPAVVRELVPQMVNLTKHLSFADLFSE